jgi:hypothetical protein
MRTAILLILILSLSGVAVAQEAILVKGEPPLTEKMVARYTRFISWLLDASLTPDQNKHLRDTLIGYWKDGKKAQMQDVLGSLNLDVQIESKSEAEKHALLTRMQPQALKDLREQKNNPDARWLVSLYESAHKPIAPGTVPLTKESVDAYADWMFFVIGQSGGIKQEPSVETRNQLVSYFAANYPGFSSDVQQRFSEIPGFWSALQLKWSQMSEQEHETQRTEWRKQLAPLLQQQQKQNEGLKALEELNTASSQQRTQIANRLQTLAAEIGTLGGEYNQGMAKLLTDAAGEAKSKTFTVAHNREKVARYLELIQLHVALYSGLRPW